MNPVHIDVSGGIYVTTPTVTESSAEVKIVTTMVNSGNTDENIVLQTQLFDPTGKLAGSANSNSALTPGQTIEIMQDIQVNKPALWSIDDPNLYQVKASVLIDDNVVDNHETPFGIRNIKMDAQNGFSINGETLDLIGGREMLNRG